jgi:hypothetical protein
VHEDEGSGQFVATGGFDQMVKIWTIDGQPLHTFVFLNPISTITYVPPHRALWISDGRKVFASHDFASFLFCVEFYFQHCFVCDPKSGEEITKFLGTFATQGAHHTNDYR